MDEFTEPLNKERNRNPAMVSIQLRIHKKMLKAIDNIVVESGSSRSHWIREAIARAIKNWKSPFENPNVWPRCRHCNKRHDPATHGLDDE